MTDTRITPFLFEGEHTVREIDQHGAPWFIASDPCSILNIRDVSQAVAKLDDDERGTCLIRTLGGQQEVLIVSESGLYALILRSRDAMKPGTTAHRLRKWVTSEVLPSIRRTGQYVASETAPGMNEDIQMQDGLKLRKVNLCHKLFGERAGQQMWRKVDLEWVPAMASVFSQGDMFDRDIPPGSVTITVTPQDRPNA